MASVQLLQIYQKINRTVEDIQYVFLLLLFSSAKLLLVLCKSILDPLIFLLSVPSTFELCSAYFYVDGTQVYYYFSFSETDDAVNIFTRKLNNTDHALQLIRAYGGLKGLFATDTKTGSVSHRLYHLNYADVLYGPCINSS